MKKLNVLTVTAVLAISAAFGMTCTAAEAEQNVVETTYGKVQGINNTVEGYEDVVEFRGIPYAAPPVGELRWKAPQDPEAWEDVLVCDTYKDIPMQVLGGAEVEPYKSDFYFDGVPAMSEDCLYLNVVTTGENLENGEKKPVFVWFHGGGLTSCYTFEPEADGAAFAMNDVVVVSVEQRLGVFGYLSLPQLTEEQGQSATTASWIRSRRWNGSRKILKRSAATRKTLPSAGSRAEPRNPCLWLYHRNAM